MNWKFLEANSHYYILRDWWGEAGRGEIGKNNLLEVRRSRNREARMLNGSSMKLLKASRMIQK